MVGEAPRQATEHNAPYIHGGHYASADGRVTMDVDVHGRRARFRFTLLCRDPALYEYVTPGPKPAKVHLSGNRVGARVSANGIYEGASESGYPGEQVTDWGLSGRFTSPTAFRGEVEFETATAPAPPVGSTPPPLARPQCLGSASISLRREP